MSLRIGKVTHWYEKHIMILVSKTVPRSWLVYLFNFLIFIVYQLLEGETNPNLGH